MFGSYVIDDTGMLLGIPFVICTHSEFTSEILVFLNNPPLTPPAKTVSSLLSLGSNIIPLVLPPTLFGPLEDHFISSDSPGTEFDLTDLILFCLRSY